MSKDSPIQWCGSTWPIVTGCEFASDGCPNCYAMLESWIHSHHPNPKISGVFAGTVRKSSNGKLMWTGEVFCHPQRLDWVLNWGNWVNPELVFVCNLGDLFHEKVPFEFVDQAIAYMILASWNKYQILTKRPQRMLEYFTTPDRKEKIQNVLVSAWNKVMENPSRKIKAMLESPLHSNWLLEQTQNLTLPLDNVWLGVSVCNQEDADNFIEPLLQTPAAIRYLSLEPLLGDIDLSNWLICPNCNGERLFKVVRTGLRSGRAGYSVCPECNGSRWRNKLHWAIIGGESGKLKGVRPTYIKHLRSVFQQLQDARISTFVKQLGKFPIIEPEDNSFPSKSFGNKTGNPELDGRQVLLKDKKGGDINEFPKDLKVREYPVIE
ncbi:MAG TPA: DUF5131 family protein [Nostocaceae cyanobacterium]|nr:DUF5131 family protein [Nostocaceae cyanobacterium]